MGASVTTTHRESRRHDGRSLLVHGGQSGVCWSFSGRAMYSSVTSSGDALGQREDERRTERTSCEAPIIA